MDPLSALSVAASTVQFVDFGCRLFSNGKELYSSTDGALIGHKQSEEAANRLVELTENLKISLQEDKDGGLADGDQALEAICNGCIGVAEHLLPIFQKLRVEHGTKYRRWQSFRKAFISVWSRKEVEAIALQLQQYSEELRTHVLVSIVHRFEKLSLSNNDESSGLDRSLQSSVRELIGVLDSVQRDIKNSIDDKASKVQQELDDATDSSLLASLWFQSMELRYEEVPEAHRKTFQWMYRSDRIGKAQQWDSLSDWLSGDGRIYWLSGKAGSGKSTLMRYIYDHEDTLELLRRQSPDFLVVKYFFWNSGSKEQRSQEGLFRCLLFEALNHRRDLIRMVFPEQWAKRRSLGQQSHNNNMWSLSTLKKGFERLTKMSSQQFSMCFLVDGLDECEGTEESGNHRALGEFLMTLTSPFVKFCLSSRPWRVFTEMFDGYPKLRLQDLTEHDIRDYVTDELATNGRLEALQELGPDLSINFVDEIVSRAEGVFLWVTLVLKSIVNGIGRHETPFELKRRLRRLPSDLKDLYDHMFARIDASDMQKAAQIIQIFEAFNYHATVLRLGFALEATYENAICCTWNEWSSQDIMTLYNRTVATLRSTCLGFIEIHYDRHLNYDRKLLEQDLFSNDEHLPRLVQDLSSHRIFYIHRTVREYVQSEEIKEKLAFHTRNLKDFNATISNLMASILLCKALPPIWHQKTVLKVGQLEVSSREYGLQHNTLNTRYWDYETRSRHTFLLDHLYSLQYNIMRYCRVSLCDKDFVNTVPDQEAQEFEAEYFLGAIACGYSHWALQRLKLIKRFPIASRPLFSSVFGGRAVHRYPLNIHFFYGPNRLKLAEFMLQHGMNVNDTWSVDEPGWTVWGAMLISLDNDLNDPSYLLTNEQLQLRLGYMCAFIEHGPDTEIELWIPYSTDTGGEERRLVSAERVLRRFEELEIEGAGRVRQLLEKHRRYGWKNTAPTEYREPASSTGTKRAREESYAEWQSTSITRRRTNDGSFSRYRIG